MRYRCNHLPRLPSDKHRRSGCPRVRREGVDCLVSCIVMASRHERRQAQDRQVRWEELSCVSAQGSQHGAKGLVAVHHEAVIGLSACV
jgi:hypothetical protein